VLAGLPSDAWTVFHDLRWPGRRFANVDHVVVGPPGVFVIDSKNWVGTIRLRHNVLSSNGSPKEREVNSAAEAALAVGQLVPLLRPDLVRPVLCFVRDEPISGWARDVMVTSTATLLEMLASRPPGLTPEEVRQVSLDLDGGFRSAMAAPVNEVHRQRPQIASAAPRSMVEPPMPRRKVSTPRRKGLVGGLVKLVAVVAFLAVFLGKPGLQEGVARWFTDLFASGTVQEQAPEKGKKGGTDSCPDAAPKSSCTPDRGPR
jgi:hypothetical protein